MVDPVLDPIRPVSTWGRIALWQVTGLVSTTVLLGAYSVGRLALSSSGLEIESWPSIFFASAFWIVSAGVFMLPLTVAALFIWTRCVRRWPAIESSYATMIPGLFLLALVTSLVVGAINNWEIAVGQVEGNVFREAVAGMGYLFVPILVALVVPRVVVPVLRPGAFAGELSAAAV